MTKFHLFATDPVKDFCFAHRSQGTKDEVSQTVSSIKLGGRAEAALASHIARQLCGPDWLPLAEI